MKEIKGKEKKLVKRTSVNEPEKDVSKKRVKVEKQVSENKKFKPKSPSKKPLSKPTKLGKKGDPTNLKSAKAKKFPSAPKAGEDFKKVEDWNKFKKEKKELKLKRIKAKNKDNYERIQEAKKMGEKVRLKTLKEDERNKVINQLHGLLKGQYAKFVLAHDTARIVQWLLKYSSELLVHQISQELVPVTVNMLHSKYGIFCVKRLLKYGKTDIRMNVIDQMKGHAVKLATNVVSAPVLEFAYSNWASPVQKQFLVQEFYGDLYKNSKDPAVKHIKDVYTGNGNMKAATLGACKTNIKKVLNKSLMDSGLVQTVISQFLEECSSEDKAEIISELAAHVVVISNSRDGSKAAMQCIWHGTNKDKKIIMKTLKEHLVELCKHEFGHRTVISLLDSVDDTVLLHKLVLSEILTNAKDLAVDEWGRKVLLWLVAPDNPKVFHPKFIQELKEGREASTSKKSPETRRQEVLTYSIPTLLNLVIEDTKFWLSTGSLVIEMLTILKAGEGKPLEEALEKIVETIGDEEWKIKEGEDEIVGIEHAGVHMMLKKLAQHDKVARENEKVTFGQCLVNGLSDKTLKNWLKVNRGCFLLVAAFENNDENVQKQLKSKLKPHLKLLKSQTTTGASILLKKCNF